MPASPSRRTTPPVAVATPARPRRSSRVRGRARRTAPSRHGRGGRQGSDATRRRVRRSRWRRRVGARQPTFADRVVQLGRLAERRDPELAVEERDQLAVLADRAAPIAGRGEQLDEPPLPELVERVERPRAGAPPRPPRPHRPPPAARQPAGRAEPQPTVRPARRGPPASRRTSGLSRSAKPARNGPRARAAAASRSAARRRPRPAARSPPGPPRVRVGVDGRRCARSMSNPTPPTADRSADSVRRSAPRAGLVVGVRPEHRGQLVPRERPPLGGDRARRSPAPCGCRRPSAGRPRLTSSGPSRWIDRLGIRRGIA